AVVASQSPFAGSRGVQVRTSEGSEPLAARAVDTAGPDQVHVGPRYFETLGLPILEGRGLETADDRATSAPVAVVSASMARAFWRGESPVGACLWIEAESVCTRVVGVSGDVRWNGLGSPASLIVYLPAGQRDDRAGHVLVRTTGEPSAWAGALRREIQAISADIRFVGVRPLVGIVASEAAPWRLGATLGSVFGGLASSVAMLGLYGLISFRVAQGRREIAIRGALGAPRPAITRRVLADGMGLLATGLFGGLLGAVVSSRWVAPLLVDVPSRDPSLYGIVTIALLVAGALACALPAYRATRVDPGVILRSE
ncbi:MAG: ABC transporter permease, partial [Gemmatimonadetes bacterium]|nr:ABC transporter permease [Gemmatimonadota bacterium]